MCYGGCARVLSWHSNLRTAVYYDFLLLLRGRVSKHFCDMYIIIYIYMCVCVIY